MPRSVRAKVQGLAIALILLLAYYFFLFDIALSVKDSIVDYLSGNNMTMIDLPLREYNASNGQWEARSYQFDILGLLDLAMTLALVFAPIIIIIRYLW